MIWEWLRPKPTSKPKFQGYASSTAPKLLKPLTKLGLRLRLNSGGQRTCITPPAIRESVLANSEADTAPETAELGQGNVTNAPTFLNKPAEDTKLFGVSEKDKAINQETPQDVVKSPADPQAPTIEKEAPEKMEIVLASLAVPL